MRLSVYGNQEDDRDLFEAERAAERQRRAKADALWRRQRKTAPDDPWWPIAEEEVPDGVRFDLTRRSAGSVVQVSYGTFDRYEACDLDPYMCIHDRSIPDTIEGPRYYRRRDV